MILPVVRVPVLSNATTLTFPAASSARVFYVLGSGFSFGAQILIARRNGERNFSKIGPICYASVFFLLLLSVILIIFIRCFSPSILAEIIKSKDICDSTIQYMNYRAYGLFFAFGAAIFRAFYVGIARTKILTYASIAMVGSNFVLNYALIFGKFGLPAMGIAGAATASSISEAISLLCYIVYSLKVVDVVKYGFHCLKAFCKISILKKVFAVSFWMMLQPFLSVGIWFLFFLAVEHLGERSLAVINLARSLSALPFMVIHACATAANSLTGNLIGAEKVDQVWRLIGKISLACTAIVLPMLIIFSIFPQETLRIYTDNHELIKASVNVVYVMNIASKANMAWRNDFKFGNFNLAALITARLGGIVYSNTQAKLDWYGVSEVSAAARDAGGVLINGNDLIDANQWFTTIAGSDTVPQYYTYSATNVRLQEVSFGYTIPRKRLGNVCDLTLQLVGRNLLMIYCKAPFDPEAVASTTDNYYQGLDYFMTPNTRNIGFNIRLNF